MERRALARGLEALLGKGGVPMATSQSVQAIPVESIRPNPHQPRRVFDMAALAELQASIARDGLLQPIVVRRLEDGYELIAGERRWRACQALGIPRIPALVRSVEEDQQLVLALVENLQRAELNAIDEARAFRQLLEEFGLTHEEVAQRVGRERSTVSNGLRLLDLPETAREAVSRGTISAGHGRALLPLAGRPEFAAAFARVVDEGLSVRATEALVREILNPPTAESEAPEAPGAPATGTTTEVDSSTEESSARDAILRDLESRLRGRWGTLVRVKVRRRGGEITFACGTRAELDFLLERLERATWPGERVAPGGLDEREFQV